MLRRPSPLRLAGGSAAILIRTLRRPNLSSLAAGLTPSRLVARAEIKPLRAHFAPSRSAHSSGRSAAKYSRRKRGRAISKPADALTLSNLFKIWLSRKAGAENSAGHHEAGIIRHLNAFSIRLRRFNRNSLAYGDQKRRRPRTRHTPVDDASAPASIRGAERHQPAMHSYSKGFLREEPVGRRRMPGLALPHDRLDKFSGGSAEKFCGAVCGEIGGCVQAP